MSDGGSEELKYVFIFIAISSILIAIPASCEVWMIDDIEPQDLDTEWISGQRPNMVIDENGVIHIAYFHVNPNNIVKYVNNSGGVWNDPIVIATNAELSPYSPFAIDSKGYPHIIYANTETHQLQYVKWNGSTWVYDSIVLLQSYQYTLGYSTLALDNDDNPHVALSDPVNRTVLYANKLSTSWNITIIESFNYYYTRDIALKIDSENKPHVIYYSVDNYAFRYCVLNGSWVIQNIPNTAFARYVDLVIDDSDTPYISYYDETNNSLISSKLESNEWKPEVVDEGGRYCSLYVDGQEIVYIAHFNEDTDEIKLAVGGGGVWNVSKIQDDADLGQSTAISLLNGEPRICYHNFNRRDMGGGLRIARPVEYTPEFLDVNITDPNTNNVWNYHSGYNISVRGKITYTNNQTWAKGVDVTVIFNGTTFFNLTTNDYGGFEAIITLPYITGNYYVVAYVHNASISDNTTIETYAWVTPESGRVIPDLHIYLLMFILIISGVSCLIYLVNPVDTSNKPLDTEKDGSSDDDESYSEPPVDTDDEDGLDHWKSQTDSHFKNEVHQDFLVKWHLVILLLAATFLVVSFCIFLVYKNYETDDFGNRFIELRDWGKVFFVSPVALTFGFLIGKYMKRWILSIITTAVINFSAGVFGTLLPIYVYGASYGGHYVSMMGNVTDPIYFYLLANLAVILLFSIMGVLVGSSDYKRS